MIPRFFLAHAKNVTDEDLEQMVADASVILDRLAQGKDYDLTLGRVHFEHRFKACGSWDAWCNEIATGVDYPSRSPLFRAILVPDGPIGAATAKIVQAALGAQKTVISFDGVNARRVKRVVTLNSKDWKTGWILE